LAARFSTDVCEERFGFLVVSSANQRSTRFSQDAPVVKRNSKRGRRSSQRWISGLLWSRRRRSFSGRRTRWRPRHRVGRGTPRPAVGGRHAPRLGRWLGTRVPSLASPLGAAVVATGVVAVHRALQSARKQADIGSWKIDRSMIATRCVESTHRPSSRR
jgi:hypothetical protein